MRHRVLVVDDEPMLRRTLGRELEGSFDVVMAADDAEALRVLHGTEEIAAVVSDYNLGTAADGLDVLRAARNLWPSCVRVLVSGSVPKELVAEVLQQGVVHAAFEKPWDCGAVKAVLEQRVLGAKAGSGTVSDLVAGQLLDFIRRRDATAFITQTLSTSLKLSAESTAGLLTSWLDGFGDPAKKLITDFLPGLNGEPPLSEKAQQARVGNALLLLTKAATIINRLGISDRELAWICGPYRDAGWLDFNDLPVSLDEQAGQEPELGATRARFQALMRLADLASLRRRFKAGPNSLVELFELTTTDEGATFEGYRGALCEKTDWSAEDVDALRNVVGLAYPSYPGGCRNEVALCRLADLLASVRRLGVSASTALHWTDVDLPISPSVGPSAGDISAQILQTAKAKYSPESWLDIARPLRNELRAAERDALVAHLLTRTPPPDSLKYSDVDALYADLLIDVEMSPCQLTARIKQATSAVQLFIQRCLLSLETDVPLGQCAAREYSWMRSYRLWEANRKVFLYPENWIEPELRDDKTPEFLAFEAELRQGELTNDKVEQAYTHYLEKLDTLSRLDVVGMVHQTAAETDDDGAIDALHVFGRTARGKPHSHYHRQWVDGSHWTAWRKIDLDISADHLLPVVYGGRLLLFWPTIEQRANENAPIPDKDATPTPPDQRLEVKLSWSEFRDDRWLAPRMAEEPVPPFSEVDTLLPACLSLALETGQADASDAAVLLMRKAGEGEHRSQVYEVFGRYAIGACGGVRWVDPGSQQATLEQPFYAFSEFNDYREIPLGLENISMAVRIDSDGEWQYVDLFETVPNHPFIVHVEHHYRTPAINAQLWPLQEFFYRDGKRVFFAHLPGKPAAGKPAAGKPAVEWTASEQTKPKFIPPMASWIVASSTISIPQLAASTVRSAGPLTAAPPGGGLSQEAVDWAYNPATSINVTTVVSGPKWHFHTFYHPYVCDLMGLLFRAGVDGLLRWTESAPLQLQASTEDVFQSDYSPNELWVDRPYPIDEFDFSFGGAYSIYNWELFFHVPLLIAVRLMQDRRFEEARRWFHAIFNPTDAANSATPDDPARFWKVKPFYENKDLSDILEDMVTLEPETEHGKILKYKLGGEEDDENPAITLEQQIDVWRANPFNPHLIARMRPLAYQKMTVMRYVDNLIAWGDDLFSQDTMESINEATMLYVLAASLLGPKPTLIEPSAEPVVKTYADLEIENKLDAFSNALENLVSAGPALSPGANAPPGPLLQGLYFGIPLNDQLLGYWDLVADRLFKIRHCMNIEGVVQELPLYEPPIDPALLVRAAAMGLDLGSVLSDVQAPAPFYRYSVLQQKAVDFAQGVTGLGGAILAALEKRDAEALSRLRAGQESALLDLVKDTRGAQIREANENLAALLEGQKVVQARYEFYRDIPAMTAFESGALAMTQQASVLQAVGQGIQAAAGLMYLIPTFDVGIAGMDSPVSVCHLGGDMFGKGLEATSQVVSMLAGICRDQGQMLGTQGSYDRRWQEWKLQERLAAQELKQIDKQILATRIRIEIAQSELASQEKQIESAKEVEAHLRDKFTNDELYDWMASELSGVYFQSYKLAYDMARRAEKAYQFERAEPNASFITFGYWDSRRQGLCAGEKLLLDLRGMEASYLSKNRREYEITKHISLAEQFPLKLLLLRATGSVQFKLLESLFDLDYPGHYMRRLKSVSLTIPAVTILGAREGTRFLNHRFRG